MTSRQKFFIADSHEAALELAAAYFGHGEFETEVISESTDTRPCLVLGIDKTRVRQISNLNAEFSLFYEPDGVYMEVYPPRGSGSDLNRESVLSYVIRKGIKMMSLGDVSQLITKKEGRSKIAPAQQENILNEDVMITFTSGDMEAYLQFMPADPDGSSLDGETVWSKITASGVVFGVDGDEIEAAIAEKSYKKRYLIAKGQPPENGVDGAIEFHFNTGRRTMAPKEIEKGRIDYKQLDLFISVKEGQLLVTRHLPTPGTPGQSVKGREIRPKAGKNVNLPRSKNTTTNEEKTELYAGQNGLVDYVGGAINVSNVYAVKGDCDMKVGNIDFDGSISITGNVISGLKIKATGSIMIGGVVEGSDIIAGGNIEIKRGIQGSDKGKVEAGGSIKAQFIERANVVAGDDIIADALIHSTVEAGHSLLMSGKRSSIMGGSIRVETEVIAKTIGSVMHTLTDIEVGLMPHKRKRIIYLQQEVKRLKAELEKLEKLETYLGKSSQNMDTAARESMLISLQGNKSQTSERFQAYSEELKELEWEAENSTGGKVHVLETIYPGAKITIGSDTFRVNEDINYATFKVHDGGVSYGACEVSKSSISG